ncbi:MAG: hypothetical protein K6U08_04605 [Firmicutes bacterium]|nr:hypothetical protein [Bacillota bacterium]
MTWPRLKTGVPGLDAVLGGGLGDASLNLLSGPPGVGKTVMAQQVVYSGATAERPALYFTTTTEPLEKVIAHVQGFAFFRRELIGRAVQYHCLGENLSLGGLTRVLETLRAELTRTFPAYLVIDSFRAFRDFAPSQHDLAVFLHELAGTLSAVRCLTLLLDESPLPEVMGSPAAAVVDGIIHLQTSDSGRSDRRCVQVIKLRGSGYLPGLHLFSVDARGVTVFPRLASLVPDPTCASVDGLRPSGIPGLDLALGGGLPSSGVAVVSGCPGAGKTALGLSWVLAGAASGEPGVFASTHDYPARLRRTGPAFGSDVGRLEHSGLLRFLYVPPLDVEVDRVGLELLRAVESLGARRVVLDAVTDLETAAIPPDDYQGFIYALSHLLCQRGATVLFTASASGSEEDACLGRLPAARLADVLMRVESRLTQSGIYRVLRVVKARSSETTGVPHPFHIVPGRGVIVGPAEKPAAGEGTAP